MSNIEIISLAGYEISPKVELDGKDLFSWDAAQGLADKMNVENWLGCSEWRLPSKEVWEKIIEDEEAFREAFGRPVERYWSSSAYDDSSSYAWYVLFYYGRVSYDAKNIDHLVRLVRGGD